MMGQVIQGNCLDVLSDLQVERFHCCITSPPYYGLRNYGVAGQDWPEVSYAPMPGLPEITVPAWEGCLGMEPTPEMFVAHIVLIFREVWRVLRDDGTLWLNFGDSYANNGRWGGSSAVGRQKQQTGLKPKDLMGIPWRVAFALQADGWHLRQDVIWHKPNPMPESVKDRCTKAHEYVFLFSKSQRYYFDNEAIKEPATPQHPSALSFERETKEDLIPGQGYKQHRLGRASGNKTHKYVEAYDGSESEAHRLKSGLLKIADKPYGVRNKRSVWSVATKACSEAHFATYPPSLIEPCVLAGCPIDGEVLDPFGGAGTTGMVCKRHRREYTLIELSKENCAIAHKRIEQEPHPQLSLLDIAV